MYWRFGIRGSITIPVETLIQVITLDHFRLGRFQLSELLGVDDSVSGRFRLDFRANGTHHYRFAPNLRQNP